MYPFLRKNSAKSLGYSTEENASFNTEQRDDSKLADVLGVLLFRNPHPLCKMPLLRCFPPSPGDLQDLPKPVQQLGAVLVDLVGCSTWSWC